MINTSEIQKLKQGQYREKGTMINTSEKLPLVENVDEDVDKQDEKTNQASLNNTYRDYSKVPDEEARDDSFACQSIAKKDPKFPVKLHMILSNPVFQDVISWLPHGRSWRIINQKLFEERVIPLFFRHSQYSSFARQVNGWGFRRITKGNDINSYYHELFLRGKHNLCHKMKRLTKKDLEMRKHIEDSPPPDFYELSEKNPLPERSTQIQKISASSPGATEADLSRLGIVDQISQHPSLQIGSHQGLLREMHVARNNLLPQRSPDDAMLSLLGIGPAAAAQLQQPLIGGISASLRNPLDSITTSLRNPLDSLTAVALRQRLARNNRAEAEIAAILGMGGPVSTSSMIGNSMNGPLQRGRFGF